MKCRNLFIAATVMLVLSACGSSGSSDAPAPPPPPANTWNDMTWGEGDWA